ncbi:50S ribosomal protein L18 [Buchnera aphidicola]|uniref:50S ribosomal protein L18 n=1 Tax=Buchnera aphidicola TaxID=9 RepID=UPI0034647EB8
MHKKKLRIKRARRFRHKISLKGVIRLIVHRTSRHIYAQVLDPNNSNVLVSASSLEKKLFSSLKYTGNKESASLLGEIIAKRSLKKGIKKVAFDRSGFQYHGRIKAVADSARKFGLSF